MLGKIEVKKGLHRVFNPSFKIKFSHHDLFFSILRFIYYYVVVVINISINIYIKKYTHILIGKFDFKKKEGWIARLPRYPVTGWVS